MGISMLWNIIILLVEIHMTWNFVAHEWKKWHLISILFAMPFSTHPLANHYCSTSDSPFAFRDHTSHKSVSASLRTLEQQSIMSRVDLTSIPARPTDGGEMNATIDTATHVMIKSAGAAQRSEYLTNRRSWTLKNNNADERIACSTILS